jgi:hypothetical protein
LGSLICIKPPTPSCYFCDLRALFLLSPLRKKSFGMGSFQSRGIHLHARSFTRCGFAITLRQFRSIPADHAALLDAKSLELVSETTGMTIRTLGRCMALVHYIVILLSLGRQSAPAATLPVGKAPYMQTVKVRQTADRLLALLNELVP